MHDQGLGGASPQASATWPRSAAVIGSGTMGGGFVQLLALAGIDVAVVDVSPDRAHDARRGAIRAAADFAAAGMMPADAEQRVSARVRVATSIPDGVLDVDLVLESVTEDPELKAHVLAQAEREARARPVVASNTSAIPIATLASTLDFPERFLGVHWFNPPQWVPLVEVIPAAETAAGVVQGVHALLCRLGKRPVTVGDAAGFVANRIQFAMFKEAASVVADGVATAEQVDEVVRMSFGFRLPFFGPFAVADMAGLDVYAGAYDALEAALGERFSAPPALTELVRAGHLGAKTGRGFLPPGDIDRTEQAAARDRAYHALSGLLGELARK